MIDDAVDVSVGKWRTPMHVQLHLTLALEAGHPIGERGISVASAGLAPSRHTG
ncbi:hypothetical protein QCE63_35790 [Caballeronia sp. LZ065]|uniref:hypothetical protein n=1 Tax=Caballeronia sp. LZ065 TaxID=3038571 RepID=UPI002864FA9D|nr:hypothetical protein [Caballeronia sp. LZ065]MDR5784755.1 hypothetical protein [Caballeronia sp. LZ065]